MQQFTEYVTDVLIIGSGAAGLSLALRIAEYCKVIVLSKHSLNKCSTWYAQGGIAAVFEDTDSINSHVEDTLNAGAGLCDREVVEYITSNARHCIEWLVQQGVLFDVYDLDLPNKINSNYHLTREGGHSHRRILHVADATGKAIETILIKKAMLNPNIHIIEHSHAIDLITSNTIGLSSNCRVVGAYIWNRSLDRVERCYAFTAIVLATGGASTVYQYTTNPDISSGDGIAMAWRAGCRVANLEFNQFHPTSLYHPQARNFLLTEALRGEGAYLYRPDGSRFMPDFDLRAELAPRDIVTRAIDHEIRRLGVECMYLDISYRPKKLIRNHFPTIYKKLQALNMDLTSQPIPIVPAAHYTCGGVIVDKNGRTDLDGLYAIGEVSYTGLHGANRLASNSLLECFVYSWAASVDIIRNLPTSIKQVHQLPPWNDNKVISYHDHRILLNNWKELQRLMWNDVGIIRTTKQLERALRNLQLLTTKSICASKSNVSISDCSIKFRNLLLVAKLIVQSALQRQESRGLHYILDYPTMLPNPQPTILQPGVKSSLRSKE
ncbi:L-aspartate oxidase [Candidatus Palibaumannia cicadellinicola]|uniref:L-aspartate oxidase n=1 Tax=Baumannia cicadellinicola subsp. Homalodisca coagulata TaxID=374463 RepID=Q1LSM4_BAUCH|nr:L-aspartate oxidase [Candidatus Baumannia cicadellinicola]ABF13775.1 L-aspartate oxidase [Baumannia cicadellinicola str. Hc (Homalodisca coagulata)]